MKLDNGLSPLCRSRVHSKAAVRPKINGPLINAIIWLLRTGTPWRALPEEYGSWSAVYSLFRRWQIKGFWKAIFLALASDPDLEAVMIDGTYIHAHKHSAGAKGGSTDKLWAAVAEVLPPNCMHR